MKRRAFIIGTLLSLFLLFSSAYGMVFDKAEYAARRLKLMGKIPDGVAIIRGADLSGSYNEFFQNNDFIYFSGVEIPGSILIIDGVKKESILFFTISERSARGEGISLDLVRNPKDITGIEKVYPVEQFSSVLNRLGSETKVFYTPFKPQELMRECTNETFRMFQRTITLNEWDGRLTRELQLVELLKERHPDVEIRDCSPMIWDLRIIKSPAEIELLRKAGRIGVKAHIEMMKATRPGMHEYELAALYEYICKKEGAQDLAYYCIICSGENHPYGHYYKHDRVLKDGDFLVVDVGPDYNYYDIDITISFPANGRFTPRQKEVYEAVLAVHRASVSLYKPGVTLEEVEKGVEKILKRQGFDLSDEIFKQRGMRGRFGHYIGMAVHDVGGSPTVLKPGMVFVNEPSAKFPEEEIGVRIENTFVVTEDGIENLTDGIPRDVKDIEALMKQDGAIQVLKKAGLY